MNPMLPLNFYIPDAPPVGAPSIPRAGSIRLHDTTIGIWEDAVNERDFQQQVFGPLIRFLRDAGWKIWFD